MARETYAQRIARKIAEAAREGRQITRQEARGHRRAEHRVRAERKTAREAGAELPKRAPVRATHEAPTPAPERRKSEAPKQPLTSAQRGAVRRHAYTWGRNRANLEDDDDLADLADRSVTWAMAVGYERFREFVTVIRNARKQWLADRRMDMPYPAKGKGILGPLEDIMARWDNPPLELVYYH